MNLFSSKNSYVLTAIRNSVEHGNISEYEDKIILTNKTNQMDFNSTNFICEASCNDFYEIISKLDDGEDNTFNFNDMLEELKFILTKETYNNLKIVLDKIKNIHQTALINVLKNKENKNLS